MTEAIDDSTNTEASTPAYMLTTVDNPYNPFTEFREWLTWDDSRGYGTCGLLARILVTSDELTDADQAVARNDAIDEVVRENVLGLFRKVSRESFKTSETKSES